MGEAVSNWYLLGEEVPSGISTPPSFTARTTSSTESKQLHLFPERSCFLQAQSTQGSRHQDTSPGEKLSAWPLPAQDVSGQRDGGNWWQFHFCCSPALRLSKAGTDCPEFPCTTRHGNKTKQLWDIVVAAPQLSHTVTSLAMQQDSVAPLSQGQRCRLTCLALHSDRPV